MDKDLEIVIKLLNHKSKSFSKRSLVKDFRIRPSQYAKVSIKGRIQDLETKTSQHNFLDPSKSVNEVLESPIEDALITEVAEYYKEKDHKREKNYLSNTVMPSKLEQSPEKMKFVAIQKFLIFKPYIDPMSTRPKLNSDSAYLFKFINSEIKLIRYTLEDNGFKEASANKRTWSILWHGGAAKNIIYESLSKYQKINHFPRSYEITRKDLMCKNLLRMQAIHGQKHYDFFPKSFVMPNDAGQLEYEMNLNQTTWIVKPSASSQGKGIFLVNHFAEVPKKDHVVSQYIENPLLIDGLKFDLRIYVAITCVNPLRIYMYKDGLVRFATQKYSEKDRANKFMHLTNYSVNKFSENFVENENALEDGQGSKWSILALRRLFKEQGIDDEKIWVKIKDIVIKTVLAIESTVFVACENHVPFRNNCFELLGFDILIDDLLTPWLLEVNLSPSLNCDAPIDQKIKGELISDLFNLTGIVSLDYRRNFNGQFTNKAMNYLSYMQKFVPIQSRKKKISNKKGKNLMNGNTKIIMKSE